MMRRVANCILVNQRDEVLLLKKPRRSWWVAPGGKMEPGETIMETVRREFWEETGVTLIDPELRGIFTILVEDKGQVQEEWMLFTFYCTRYEGFVRDDSPEGELAWIPISKVASLPKAEGDQLYFKHILEEKKRELLIGRFRYTPEYQLVAFE